MKIKIMSEDLDDEQGYAILEEIAKEINKVRTTGYDDDILEFELEIKNITVRQRTEKEIEEGFETFIG